MEQREYDEQRRLISHDMTERKQLTPCILEPAGYIVNPGECDPEDVIEADEGAEDEQDE